MVHIVLEFVVSLVGLWRHVITILTMFQPLLTRKSSWNLLGRVLASSSAHSSGWSPLRCECQWVGRRNIVLLCSVIVETQETQKSIDILW